MYRHGAILLILQVRSGFSTRRFRTDEEIRESAEALEKEEEVNERRETAHNQTRGDIWVNFFYETRAATP